MTTPLELPVKVPGAPEAAAQVDKLSKGFDKLGKSAAAAGDGVDEVAKPSALERLKAAGESIQTTANNTLELAQKALAAAQHVAELAAATDRTQLAMTRLGPAAREVEAATAGVVTVTEAYNTQQALVRSGLRLTNEQLVTLTRGAREHARALGLDTAEALDKLTQSIRNNDAGGLRELGIVVRDGTSRAQTMRTALAALAREQRATAPATRTLGEDTTRFGRSLTDVTGAVAALIAQGTGLQGFLSSAADGFKSLTKEILDYLDADSRRPAQQAAAERRLRSIEQYTQAVREARAEANRLGVALPTFAAADQLSESARDALTGRLRGMLGSMRTGETAQVRTAQGNLVARNRVIRVGADGRQVQEARPEFTDRDWQVSAAMLRGASGPMQIVAGNEDDSRRAILSAFGLDIQAESATGARAEERRREAARRAAARAGRGPVDSANVGVAATNAAALRAAQTELGVANESLALLGVRFERLGDVIDREGQLAALRTEASRTAAQDAESEDARIARVAASRNALLAALTEERDRRQQLLDLTNQERATEAANAVAALGAARGGQRLSARQSASLAGFAGAQAGLAGALGNQRQQLDQLRQQLAAVNVPLAEQLRLRQQIAGLQSTILANEQTLATMAARDRETAQQRLELGQATADQWAGLYAQARNALEQSQALTASESEALRERAGAVERLTALESDYRAMIAQATAEANAARSEEERNATLQRRLGLLQRLASAESARRDLEREAARDNFAVQAAARLGASLNAQATQAERFAGVADAALGTFTDAFSNALLAVVKGEAPFAEAMAGMLRAVLDTIAKQALVEGLKSGAMALGRLLVGDFAGAALAGAGAAAWGAVGLAAGAASAAIPKPPAAASAAAAAGGGTSARPASIGRSDGGGGGGGSVTYNIRVDGALLNEGVEEAVVRALNGADARGYLPRSVARAARR